MFLGRFEHSVDNKGRVAVPARFRDRLSGELIMTRGNDRCLYLFTEESWEPLAAKLNALPTGDADARNLRRAVFSAAEPVEIDKQGRVMIPDHLRQYAAITATSPSSAWATTSKSGTSNPGRPSTALSSKTWT